MTVEELTQMLSASDLETIQEMASQNYGPSQIALALGYDKKPFLHVWKNMDSVLRLAYERGVLEIDREKNRQLQESIEAGSITAVQIHDKKATDQRFQDIKNTFFPFEQSKQ